MLRPVTPYVAFHYRSLQKQLLKAKIGKRIPSRIIQLSQESKIDLTWWVKSSGFKSHSTAHLREQKPTVHIWTDASLTGSGAHDSRGRFTQREWTATELASDPHINVLELIAAKEAVAELVMKGDVVRLHLDNRVACAYIARQGGTKSNALSTQACQLWDLVQSKQAILITPHWISTKDNSSADFLSRL